MPVRLRLLSQRGSHVPDVKLVLKVLPEGKLAGQSLLVKIGVKIAAKIELSQVGIRQEILLNPGRVLHLPRKVVRVRLAAQEGVIHRIQLGLEKMLVNRQIARMKCSPSLLPRLLILLLRVNRIKIAMQKTLDAI
jgi:hypothetical protein